MINTCDCEEKRAHAYCATAFVLRTQKIYCNDCYLYYNLYVKSQRLFNQELMGDISKYLIFFCFFTGAIYGIYVIDRYLKQDYHEMAYDESLNQVGLTEDEIEDIHETFQAGVQSQFIMVPLIVVLTMIMIWFFYLRFVISFLKRKKLVWVEVMDNKDPEYMVSRNEAKKNLHLVLEITQKLKTFSYLFDKYWYRQREFQYIDGIVDE